MPLGFDAIGEHAIAELIESTPAPLELLPVSRVTAGGSAYSGVPLLILDLGIGLLWDDDSEIIWDNGYTIGTEA